MTTLGSRFSRRPVRYSLLSGILVVAAAVILLIATQLTAGAAVAPVDLAAAGSFAVLGGSTVTNTGPSVLNGDLGVSPGSAITGFPPGVVNGTIHQTDGVAAGAESDLTTAYIDAAGRTPATAVPGFIGAGQTLLPGVYNATSSLDVGGALILNGQGDPDSVFIFQVSSTLVTDSASHISLINGAQACNVFWQVGSSATLGTGSTFLGSILALASITVNTGDVIEGRALARNGAVTLHDDIITVPACAPPISPSPTPSTTSASPSPTTSASPSPTTSRSGPSPRPTTSRSGPSPSPSGSPSPTPAPTPTPVKTTLPVTG
jgi:ice-binding like protein